MLRYRGPTHRNDLPVFWGDRGSTGCEGSFDTWGRGQLGIQAGAWAACYKTGRLVLHGWSMMLQVGGWEGMPLLVTLEVNVNVLVVRKEHHAASAFGVR